MPDTGAPHFIPFLDGTELVRAYPDFSEDLANAVADGLNAAPVVKRVLSVRKTDTFSSSESDWVTIPGLEITVTPLSEDSRFWIFFSALVANVGSADADQALLNLFRGSTELANPDNPGIRLSSLGGNNLRGAPKPERKMFPFSGHIVDEPNTTSSVTYSLRLYSQDPATSHVNRSSDNTDTISRGRGISTFTVVELGA